MQKIRHSAKGKTVPSRDGYRIGLPKGTMHRPEGKIAVSHRRRAIAAPPSERSQADGQKPTVGERDKASPVIDQTHVFPLPEKQYCLTMRQVFRLGTCVRYGNGCCGGFAPRFPCLAAPRGCVAKRIKFSNQKRGSTRSSSSRRFTPNLSA